MPAQGYFVLVNWWSVSLFWWWSFAHRLFRTFTLRLFWRGLLQNFCRWWIVLLRMILKWNGLLDWYVLGHRLNIYHTNWWLVTER
jgi:hypothetical protein